MQTVTPRKIIKATGLLFFIFAVGIAGVLVGYVVRDRLPGAQKRTVTMPVPMSLLREEMLFPDVALIGPSGEQVYSGSLVGEGSVVLFLDLECPPCEVMTAKWQAAADDNVVFPGRLWAVTYFPRQYVDDYVKQHNITFPVYVDSLQTFHHKYEVNRFPLEVVVGVSGHIRSMSYNSEAPVDAGRVAELLAE
jgi:peroxiredoxin